MQSNLEKNIFFFLKVFCQTRGKRRGNKSQHKNTMNVKSTMNGLFKWQLSYSVSERLS